MPKCLCGNNIMLSETKAVGFDFIYKGNSSEIIGKTFKIETTCDECKRQLTIELSITDKNW